MERDEAGLVAPAPSVCQRYRVARYLRAGLFAARCETIRSVFHALDQWVVPVMAEQHVAIDGKQRAIHLVSAWSSTSGLTLGQVKTADKSNEITAIPALLSALDINGSIITIDAMGCQHDIAAKIVQGGADYVLGVKDNQPGLAEAVKLWFNAVDAGKLDRPYWDDIQTEKDHGWIETRRSLVTDDVAWLQQQSPALERAAQLDHDRIDAGTHRQKQPGIASIERRYYISSLPAKAALLGKTVRALSNREQYALGIGCRIPRRRLPNPDWRGITKLCHPATYCAQPAQKKHRYETRHRQQAIESRLERRLPWQTTGTKQLNLHAIAQGGRGSVGAIMNLDSHRRWRASSAS